MQSDIKKNSNSVPYGASLLGRIIDGMGRPIDGKGPLLAPQRDGFHAEPPNPLSRGLISDHFSTGIKSIDTFIPLGSWPEDWDFCWKWGWEIYSFGNDCSEDLMLK